MGELPTIIKAGPYGVLVALGYGIYRLIEAGLISPELGLAAMIGLGFAAAVYAIGSFFINWKRGDDSKYEKNQLRYETALEAIEARRIESDRALIAALTGLTETIKDQTRAIQGKGLEAKLDELLGQSRDARDLRGGETARDKETKRRGSNPT